MSIVQVARIGHGHTHTGNSTLWIVIMKIDRSWVSDTDWQRHTHTHTERLITNKQTEVRTNKRANFSGIRSMTPNSNESRGVRLWGQSKRQECSYFWPLKWKHNTHHPLSVIRRFAKCIVCTLRASFTFIGHIPLESARFTANSTRTISRMTSAQWWFEWTICCCEHT